MPDAALLLPTHLAETGIVTVTLEQDDRPVVVLNEHLLRRLDATLTALPTDARGLVLASAAPRAFVAGADLGTIRDFDDAALDTYLAFGQRVFGRLAQLPYPTAAAIQGATLGGGFELAAHCDALIASPSPSGKSYPIGLPEAGLSICPGWGGTNLLPARINPAKAIELTAIGKPMKFDDARNAGMFDEVTDDPSQLLATASAWVERQNAKPLAPRDGAPARWIGRDDRRAATLAALDSIRDILPPTEPAAAVVRAIDVAITTDGPAGWQAALDVERHELTRLRHTPEGKAAIEAFFAKSEAKA